MTHPLFFVLVWFSSTFWLVLVLRQVIENSDSWFLFYFITQDQKSNQNQELVMEPGPATKLVLYSKLFFLMFEFIFPIGVRYVVNLRKKFRNTYF